jgi:hypothetical protein
MLPSSGRQYFQGSRAVSLPKIGITWKFFILFLMSWVTRYLLSGWVIALTFRDNNETRLDSYSR